MKIIFLEPRSPAEHVFSMASIPRLGNIVLAAIMERRGHRSEVIVEEISGDVDDADLASADLVAVSTITSTAPRAYAIGDRARALGKKVVFGGPHPTFLPAEALEHGHFVVRGEGEETLPELVDILESGGDPSNVAGLSWLRGREAADNPPRPLVADLDSLPIPDFDLVRGWRKKGRIVPVATSRGCPFNCKFCAVVPMFGRRMRFHSADRIIAEIKRNGRGAKHVFFCDDNFAADPRRAKDLLRRMIDEKVNVSWGTQVRVDASRDTELLDLMCRAGCRVVYIGFESINPKTLAALRKQQSPEEIQRSIRTFHHHGLRIHGMFIVGSDEDVPESINQTVNFARRMKVDTVQFMMLTPLPGTETFKELEQAGRLLTKEWNLYDGSYAVFQPRLMTAWDLQVETYRAYRRFYSWASVVRQGLRLDPVYAVLRVYARFIVARARRRVRQYKKKLQADILQKALMRLGNITDKLPRAKTVLLADTVDEPYKVFLASFLGRLGIKVQTVAVSQYLQEAGHNLRAELEHRREAIRHRAEVLIIPLMDGASQLGQQGQAGLKAIGLKMQESVPDGLRHLVIYFEEYPSFYRAAVDLGLVFSRKIGRIRRAYRLAVEEAGL